MDVGVLSAKLNLETSSFDRNMERAKSALSSFGQTIMHINQGVDLAGRVYRALDATVGNLARSFIDAADTAERYRLSLNVVLGSATAANKMFDDMARFAAKVPFEYEEIMSSATALSGVMRNGAKDVERYMPMITDLAAVTRLSIEQVTSQVIRMYSAGAASADLFRERGVLAMMGFQAGVHYTAKETRKMMDEAFADPSSKFRGAADALSQTWTGLMSNIRDQWFLVRMKIMEGGPFEALKQILKDTLAKINELWDTGKMEEWGRRVSEWLTEAITKTWEWIKSDLPGHWEKVKDVLNATHNVLKFIYGIMEAMVKITEEFSSKKTAWAIDILHGGSMSDEDLPLVDQLEKSLAKIDDLIFDTKRDLETEKTFFDPFGTWAKKMEENKAKLLRLLEDRQGIVAKIEALKEADKPVAPVDYSEFYAMDKKKPNHYDNIMYQGERKAKDEPLGHETERALERLRKTLGGLEHQKATAGMEDLERAIADAKHEAAELRIEFKKAGTETSEVGRLINQIEKVGIEAAKAQDKMQWDKALKETTKGMTDQIITLQNAIAQVGEENELTKGYNQALETMRQLRSQNDELLKKRPELETFIKRIGDLTEQSAKAGVRQNSLNMIKDIEKQSDAFMRAGANPFMSDYRRALEEIAMKYDDIVARGGNIDGLADKWREQAEALEAVKDKFATMADVFEMAGDQLAEQLVKFATAGEFSFKGLISGLVKELQIYAAQKTARLLMEAAFEGIMAFIDEKNSARHSKNATLALKGAGIMGAFVAGSGLAGMAHSGMTSIPEDGTWLLKKNERVVDSETNKDLKNFLKGGGKPNIVVSPQFYNSDEESVRRALPDLEQTIINVVSTNISSNGQINGVIRSYAN